MQARSRRVGHGQLLLQASAGLVDVVVELDDGVVEEEADFGVEAVDDDGVVPLPFLDFAVVDGELGDESVGFDGTGSVIVACEDELAHETVACGRFVRVPYLVFGQEPIGVVAGEELSPAVVGDWGRLREWDIIMHETCPQQVVVGVRPKCPACC